MGPRLKYAHEGNSQEEGSCLREVALKGPTRQKYNGTVYRVKPATPTGRAGSPPRVRVAEDNTVYRNTEFNLTIDINKNGEENSLCQQGT